EDPRAAAIASLTKAFGLEPTAAERLVAIGINSPAAFTGVEQNDLVDAGFTAEEAQNILSRVSSAPASS
ncbi:MAG: transcription termination/antitermination protein NusA, partial [Verrucomicrobiota bacterium]|nr:transcription termination/antitermination protein NusA [Verrucomicrobiota bacterium]